MLYAANSCSYCFLRSSTLSMVVCCNCNLNEGRGTLGKGDSEREKVKYDDDFIRGKPVYLHKQFLSYIQAPFGTGRTRERGFTQVGLYQLPNIYNLRYSPSRLHGGRDDVWFLEPTKTTMKTKTKFLFYFPFQNEWHIPLVVLALKMRLRLGKAARGRVRVRVANGDRSSRTFCPSEAACPQKKLHVTVSHIY